MANNNVQLDFMPHSIREFNSTIMKKAKESRLAKVPALGLSLMTFFGSMLLAFILDRISSSELSAFSTTEIIPMVIYVIVIVGASFLICRKHPKSVWYTPLICNALGILVGLFGTLDDQNSLINLSFWIVVGACLLLSVLGAIIGAKIGQGGRIPPLSRI